MINNVSGGSQIGSLQTDDKRRSTPSGVSSFESERTPIGKEARVVIGTLAQQQLTVLALSAPKDEADAEDKEQDVEFLSNLIDSLHEESAYEAAYEVVLQSMESFYDYVSTYGGRMNLVRSIQINGGGFLAEYDEFYVAQDQYGNQYFLEKHSSETIWEY